MPYNCANITSWLTMDNHIITCKMHQTTYAQPSVILSYLFGCLLKRTKSICREHFYSDFMSTKFVVRKMHLFEISNMQLILVRLILQIVKLNTFQSCWKLLWIITSSPKRCIRRGSPAILSVLRQCCLKRQSPNLHGEHFYENRMSISFLCIFLLQERVTAFPIWRREYSYNLI